MKTAILVTFLGFLMACMDAETPRLSAAEQALVCDPYCDPGNFQYLVSQVIGESYGCGTQVPGSMLCYHYMESVDPNELTVHLEHDECSGLWQDPWGQNYKVWCSSLGPCDIRACGQPDQYACRY